MCIYTHTHTLTYQLSLKPIDFLSESTFIVAQFSLGKRANPSPLNPKP